uniref:Uncharacterized protein n=1 Tax=virus sp. ctML55 TaxID=2827627 RepID=A0A8S5RIB0_9VIRU|nr:MAG TPA: hypothetical protein [virus sp. ctML55]
MTPHTITFMYTTLEVLRRLGRIFKLNTRK